MLGFWNWSSFAGSLGAARSGHRRIKRGLGWGRKQGLKRRRVYSGEIGERTPVWEPRLRTGGK